MGIGENRRKATDPQGVLPETQHRDSNPAGPLPSCVAWGRRLTSLSLSHLEVQLGEPKLGNSCRALSLAPLVSGNHHCLVIAGRGEHGSKILSERDILIDPAVSCPAEKGQGLEHGGSAPARSVCIILQAEWICLAAILPK